VQTKQMHPKAKLQNAPTITGNGSQSCLFTFGNKNKKLQLCKRQLADTSVPIDRYRLSADYRCISGWHVRQ